MASAAFTLQNVDGDLVFVRPAPDDRLSERIDLAFVGKSRDVVLLTMAVAAVRTASLQFRGLFIRAGLKELCTDPDNGRVAFALGSEWDEWIDRLVAIGPSRARELSAARGHELLLRTEDARSAVNSAWHAYKDILREDPVEASVTFQRRLSPSEKAVLECLCDMPFMLGPDAYQGLHRISLAALVLMGDAELIALGTKRIQPGSGGESNIHEMSAVPPSAVWKVRLLADAILEERKKRS